MKTIKSVILIFSIFICMSFLCSCGTKEVVGPQGSQGVPGNDGTSLHTGRGVPKNDFGNMNDSYIDLLSWNFYVKNESEWTLEGNIKSDQNYHDGTDGLEFYLLNDGTYGVGMGTTQYLNEIVIPSTYKNKPVTYIIDNGFSESILTNIEIPNSITSIGDCAFYSCSSLTSIEIPNSVTSIGNSAFRSCDSLTNIVIPNSVTSIGNSAFSYCGSLTSIVIPNSVRNIGEYAFDFCKSLTSIVIPDSVTSIGYSAFSRCSSLIIYCEASSKPSGWDSSWNYSYRKVYWGINFYEENGIQYILNTETKEATISGYVGNDANIVINETIIFNDEEYSVTSIGSYAFSWCSSLESIIIPEGVTSIKYNAFDRCNSLTIYCEVSSKPDTWSDDWRDMSVYVYWVEEWEYDTEGNPVPLN